MLCSLRRWNLTQFDELAYYDSDMYFHASPDSIFAHCPLAARMCAVRDVKAWTTRRPYYNTGLFVIRPSALVAAELWNARAGAEHQSFPDQDYLNAHFRGAIDDLPPAYNRQWFFGPLSNATIAVHERYFVLNASEQQRVGPRIKCAICRARWLEDVKAMQEYVLALAEGEHDHEGLQDHERIGGWPGRSRTAAGGVVLHHGAPAAHRASVTRPVHETHDIQAGKAIA